ncbi:MAG: DUF2807 domain-containing protein [Chitinophagaceae bacterium]|nr:DUF2807 domain-containing protein [Chitinophagaceae bacterium]
MKYAILLSFLCITFFVDAQDVINDANAQPRNIGSFDKIKVSNAFDVYLVQGNEHALAVSASETQFRDKIKTYVQNGTLYIEFDADKNFWKSLRNSKMNLKAYISFKSLEKLSVSGACNVNIRNELKMEKLDIHLSGASDLNGKIKANFLGVNLSGASDIKLSGVVENLNVSASGASDFKGYDLDVNYCTADASGASSVQVTVNKELNAKASGASDIGYKGTGSVLDIRTSGASSIKKRS